MTKLAQGRLDLHSGRSSVDFARLAQTAREAGAGEEIAAMIANANSALEALQIAQGAGVDLAASVARAAWEMGARALDNAETELEVIVFDRDGGLLARAPFRKVLS
jgi:cobalt-precorrin-5B (C1)-methyltransferase